MTSKILVTNRDDIDTVAVELSNIVGSGASAVVSIEDINRDGFEFIESKSLSSISRDMNELDYPVMITPLLAGRRLQLHVSGHNYCLYDFKGISLNEADSIRYNITNYIDHDNYCVEIIEDRSGVIYVVDVLRLDNNTELSLADKMSFMDLVKQYGNVRKLNVIVAEDSDELQSALESITSCLIARSSDWSRFVYDSRKFMSVCVGKCCRIGDVNYIDIDDIGLWNKFIKKCDGDVYMTPLYSSDRIQVHISGGNVIAFKDGRRYKSGSLPDTVNYDHDTVLFGYAHRNAIYIYDCIYHDNNITQMSYSARSAVVSNICKKISAFLMSPIREAKDEQSFYDSIREVSYMRNSGGAIVIISNNGMIKYIGFDYKEKIVCEVSGGIARIYGQDIMYVDKYNDSPSKLKSDMTGNVLMIFKRGSMTEDFVVDSPAIIASTNSYPDHSGVVFVPGDFTDLPLANEAKGRYRYYSNVVYKNVNGDGKYTFDGREYRDGDPLDKSFRNIDAVVEMYAMSPDGVVCVAIDVGLARQSLSGAIYPPAKIAFRDGGIFKLSEHKTRKLTIYKDMDLVGENRHVFLDSGYVYYGNQGDEIDIFVESDYVCMSGRYTISNGEISYSNDPIDTSAQHDNIGSIAFMFNSRVMKRGVLLGVSKVEIGVD